MSITITSKRSGLRPRNAAGRAVMVPGEYYTPTNKSTNTFSRGRVVTTTPLTSPPLSSSPLTSLTSSVSELRPGVSYSQAVSRSPSPPSAEREEAHTGLENRRGNFLSSTPIAQQARRASVANASDGEEPSDSEAGPWIEVRHGKNKVPGGRSGERTAVATPPSPAVVAPLASAHDQSPSHGEGPSDPMRKGKTVDPREWGAAQLEPEELDVETQRDMLAYYSARRSLSPSERDATSESADACASLYAEPSDAAPKPVQVESEPASPTAPFTPPTAPPASGTPQSKEQSSQEQKLNELQALVLELRDLVWDRGRKPEADSKPKRTSKRKAPPKMSDADLGTEVKPSSNDASIENRGRSLEPAAQVEPLSYLGMAFEGLRMSSSGTTSNKKTRFYSTGSPDPSSSDSEGSDGDNSSSSEESDHSTSSGTTDSDVSGARRRRRKKKHSKKHKKATFKPREPEKYNGKPDVQVFHKFIQEVDRYIRGYDLEPSEYAATISYYLTGHAYEFYTMEVSENPSSWTLHRFFVGLFNHCFPVNFRLEQREKLRDFSQGSRSVRRYVHELKTLFMMAGVISDGDKVLRLWNGLNEYLQEKLWDFNYSPTHSKWDEVVDAATRFEISASVRKLSRRGNGSNHGGGGGGGGPGNGPPRGNPGSGGGRPSSSGDKSGTTVTAATGSSDRSSNHASSAAKGNGSSGGQNKRSVPPRLSAKEKNDLRAAGKCFICKEVGHVSRHCPKANSLRSARKGQPPGVSINHIELDTAGTEQLRALATASARPVGIAVNMAHLETIDEDSTSEHEVERELAPSPVTVVSSGDGGVLHEVESELDDAVADEPWFAVDEYELELPVTAREGRPYCPIGDVYAQQARVTLRRHVPYCCSKVGPDPNFWSLDDMAVYQISETHCVIMAPHPIEDIEVPAEWLRNPEFNPIIIIL
ncbi:hypothetical protein EIP86_008131 [Pleurotus ostreatoroseus]|nr:hypothetical protein EIP86_008131 [Pleurotus ostreatoroseus]